MAGYEVDSAIATAADRRGDALVAMVRWGLAAYAAHDHRQRIIALAKARSAAELAFHQALYVANDGAKVNRLSWRDFAAITSIPWETLYRRYHRRPTRMPPSRTQELTYEDVFRMFESEGGAG